MMKSEFIATENFDVAAYWRGRYNRGGTSGAGSYGRLAAYKADFLNTFIVLNNTESLIDFGCGDWNQASLFDVPAYVGLDVSETALARCRRRFTDRPTYQFHNSAALDNLTPCDVAISMDVIYHLVTDSDFEHYVGDLFSLAKTYC